MAPKEIQIKKVNGSIKVRPKWKTLHTLDMDTVEWKVSPSNLNLVICFGKRTPFATPLVSKGCLFIRTEKALYCFGACK
jgi:hypothetical protein